MMLVQEVSTERKDELILLFLKGTKVIWQIWDTFVTVSVLSEFVTSHKAKLKTVCR